LNNDARQFKINGDTLKLEKLRNFVKLCKERGIMMYTAAIMLCHSYRIRYEEALEWLEKGGWNNKRVTYWRSQNEVRHNSSR